MIKIEGKSGDVTISSEAISDIVGSSVTECYGVAGMANASAADGLVSLLKRDSLDRGVKVEYVKDKLYIDLHIIVVYGLNIKTICESIIEKVTYNIEESTGLEVGRINVYVDKMKV